MKRRIDRADAAPAGRRLQIVLASLVVLTFAALVAAETGFLEVTKNEEGFTVIAEELSVARILRAIGNEADFEVVDATGEGESIELFEVEDATLSETMKLLLSKTNHLIVYRGSEKEHLGTGEKHRRPHKERIEVGTIDKVILLGPSDPSAMRVVREGVSPLAGPVPPPPLPTPPTAVGAEAAYTDDNQEPLPDLEEALAIELALEAALEAPEGEGLPVEVSEALSDFDPELAAEVEDALGELEDLPATHR